MKGRRLTFRKVMRRTLRFFVGTLSMAILYYVIFALIFSTDTERRLKRENDMYEKEFPELAEKEALLQRAQAVCLAHTRCPAQRHTSRILSLTFPSR